MANTYVVQSAIQNSVTDSIDIIGSVNGVPVIVHQNLSAVAPGALASAIAFENWIAPLMLVAYNILVAPTAVAAVPVAGLTFSK